MQYPPMSASRVLVQALGMTLTVVSAAMIALAAGALWMVATAYFQRDLAWLSVPMGALLGWAMRASVTRTPSFAAVLSAAATVLAALYMLALRAGMQIAGLMGVSYADALRQSGPGMLFDIARQNLAPMYPALITGAIVAAAVALLVKRR